MLKVHEKKEVFFKNFKIETDFTGKKPTIFNDCVLDHYDLKVTNLDNNKHCIFDVWMNDGKSLSTEQKILDAFYWVICDVIEGRYTFDNFCLEFGYDLRDLV